MDAIARASTRVQAVIFGPADFMASLNMKSLVVGEQPPGYDVGDAYHYILMRILLAARAHDKQAIDGPYLQVRTWKASSGSRVGRRPWASTASGCSTRTRSPQPTRCTPRCSPTMTMRRTFWTPIDISPRHTAALLAL